MDQCLIDLGPIHIGESDSPEANTRFQEVVIFGPTAAESAQSLAEKAGTISYEITCGISKRVPRVYRE
jgi:alanine racemase